MGESSDATSKCALRDDDLTSIITWCSSNSELEVINTLHSGIIQLFVPASHIRKATVAQEFSFHFPTYFQQERERRKEERKGGVRDSERGTSKRRRRKEGGKEDLRRRNCSFSFNYCTPGISFCPHFNQDLPCPTMKSCEDSSGFGWLRLNWRDKLPSRFSFSSVVIFWLLASFHFVLWIPLACLRKLLIQIIFN